MINKLLFNSILNLFTLEEEEGNFNFFQWKPQLFIADFYSQKDML